MKKLLVVILFICFLLSSGMCTAEETTSPVLPDVPNAEQQYQLLMENRDKWSFEKEYPTSWWYTFTDLDHNGRMEVIADAITGSAGFTESHFYEVNVSYNGVTSCMDDDQSYVLEYSRDRTELDCYYDRASNLYYYIDNGYVQDGAYHQYYSISVLCFANGSFKSTYLGTKTVDYEGPNYDIPVVKYNDIDRQPISEAEYIALVDNYIAGTERSTVIITWEKGWQNQSEVCSGLPLAPAAMSANLPKITKNPTDETVPINGKCQFVTRYENADLAEWHFISPDGYRDLTYADAEREFPTLKIINGYAKDMTLDSIPAALNGWRVYCRFSNNAGSADSGSALITVQGAPAYSSQSLNNSTAASSSAISSVSAITVPDTGFSFTTPVKHPTPESIINTYIPLIADRHSALPVIRAANGLEYRESYFSYGEDTVSFDRYALADLNGDGFPELILCSKGMGLVDLFTYRDNLLYIGYNRYFGFIPGSGETVVRGHWHGAGGSGTDEWSVNKLASGEMVTYFDRLGDETSRVYQFIDENSEWTQMQDSPEASALYESLYEKYVDACVRVNDLPFYEIGDLSGLAEYVDIREMLPYRDVKQVCKTAYSKFLAEKRYRIRDQLYTIEFPNRMIMVDIDIDEVPELLITSGFGSGIYACKYVYAFNQYAADFVAYLGTEKDHFRFGEQIYSGYFDSRIEHYSELQLLPGQILLGTALSDDAGSRLEQTPGFELLRPEEMDPFLWDYKQKVYNLDKQQDLAPEQKVSDEEFAWLTPERGFKLAKGFPAMGYMPKTLYRTSDGGKTWQNPIDLTQQIKNYPAAISFWNETDGIILTDCRNPGDSIIYQTSDGGYTWKPKTIDLSDYGPITGNYLGINGKDACLNPKYPDIPDEWQVNNGKVMIGLVAIYEDQDPKYFFIPPSKLRD